MFCSKCGHEIDKDAKFCKHCGSAVNVETPEPQNIAEANTVSKPQKTHKWVIIVGAILLAVIIAILAIVLYNKNDKEEFGKSITANDLELEYTVYTGKFISVDITPLVDIQDLKLQVFYYQNSNILRQDHEWLEVEFLEKGDTYSLMYDITDTYPFDRVRLSSISGKKRNNSEDIVECKRKGIIKAPYETLSTSLFTLRLDTSVANSTSYGILYIKSSVDLWDVSLQINEFYTNQSPVLYLPDSIKEMPANQEVAIVLKKMYGETGILDHVSIKSASGGKTADMIINE